MINISERYGDAVPVTIEDYQELNPDGKFQVRGDEIWEWFETIGAGGFERVAISEAQYSQQPATLDDAFQTLLGKPGHCAACGKHLPDAANVGGLLCDECREESRERSRNQPIPDGRDRSEWAAREGYDGAE